MNAIVPNFSYFPDELWSVPMHQKAHAAQIQIHATQRKSQLVGASPVGTNHVPRC